MPDQPDDAPKRPTRGVFPPFFVPRSGGGGHADRSPTPPSGSWRRVSRLFTPPEGTRQRRTTPAAQQTPYRPPPMPSEPIVPVEALAPEQEVREVAEQTDQAAAGTPEVVGAPEDVMQARAEEADALKLEDEDDAARDVAGGMGAETSPEAGDTFDPASVLFSPQPPVPESREDSLDAIAELAFDDDADDFMVESLEPQPITLDPSEVERLDVAVESMDEILSPNAAELETEPYRPDAGYDEISAAPSFEDARSSQPEPTEEQLGNVERYLAAGPAQEPALADDRDALIAPHTEMFVAYEDDSISGLDRNSAATQDEPSSRVGEGEGRNVAEYASQDREPFAASDAAGEQALEIDPWAGAELPEPAFGSIGWPAADDALAAPEPVADGVDEMSAALAWNDDEGVANTGAAHEPFGGDAATDADDALSAIAGELRETSSAWKMEGDSSIDERADVEARAHFYAAPEPIDPADEIIAEAAAGEVAAEVEAIGDADSAAEVDAAAAAEADAAAAAPLESLEAEPPRGSQSVEEIVREEMAGATGEVADPADRHAGAAIADALARVAARIRAGEIDLPPEAVGASDESALAAALAALLRGPRH